MPDSAASALFKVLDSHKANEVVERANDPDQKHRPSKVIELDSTMTTIQAANELWKNNILGAPVWDVQSQRYCGFFDMRDILSAVVASVRAIQDGTVDVVQYNTIMVKELDNLEEGQGGGGPGGVTIKYLAARNPMFTCTGETTLRDLCSKIVEHRCHRMPICDAATGRVTNIISQSALVKFLSKHVSDAALSESLKDSALDYKKDVVSIADTTPAFEAFSKLDSHRLSGIAVVDSETGQLLGNTSARDIKLAAMDEAKTAMDQDILSYLAHLRQATPVLKDRYPSCHVHEGDKVSHVINLLAKTGYHRVFVVDAERKPIGVISVADIIRFALEKGK